LVEFIREFGRDQACVVPDIDIDIDIFGFIV
jgi:hypothetical protein